LLPAVLKCVGSVVLIGTAAPEIAAALQNTVPLGFAGTMQEAVLMAQARADQGDAVLLSPACASFDMFRDFNHRGEIFATAVRSLQ